MDMEVFAEQHDVDTGEIPHHFSALAIRANQRYMQYERRDDISEAVDSAKRGIHAANESNPCFNKWLSNLGNNLDSQYERTGEMRDMEEAIQMARQAAKSTPDDHPDQAALLNNLGFKLGCRYERTGEMTDLEEAIQMTRQAAESSPDKHPDRATWLNNLGFKLGCRYERTGDMMDLEETIQMARQAVESTPDDHPDRAGRLSNLADTLDSRYERTGEMRDLEEAIRMARQAVESTPDDHPARARRLSNLGHKLENQYERTREMTDLEEAIQMARQAVESTPDNHPDQATWLNNLGNKLSTWYERTGEMRDLQESILMTRQAVESTPDDHPDRAGRLSNLGKKLGYQYARTGEMKDLEEASTSLLDAWKCSEAVPFHRVRAAALCLNLLALQHKVNDGIALGRDILDLLPKVHTRALDRRDQQFVMSTFAGVASDLCGFLLSANRLNEALQYLEQGRAVIISQLLDDRSDVSSLCRDHPNLANQYQGLVNEVNSPICHTTHSVVERLLAERRREAAAELDTCLKDIRALPGHERFLLGQTVAEMQECATEGSIVVVNVTAFRSDAILVSSHTITTLTLSEMLASDAEAWLCKKWASKRKFEQKGKNDEFLEYLSWLWQACVKPILDEISATQKHPSQGLPRVWWMGTGLASSMPFHAAGLHTGRPEENAYSRIISSYTPSIKALAHTQNQAKHAQAAQTGSDLMLIATMPTSPKGPTGKKPRDLPGVEKEADMIFEAACSHLNTTVLTNPSADQVLEVLGKCRIAHFACHGTSESSDPSNSGLILQKSTEPDEVLEQDRLTVYRVSELRLGRTQIAYLSACSTAENKSARLLDEVIHVVSGFQVAGFPHVVGCLWPAGDSECVDIARRFYTSILQQNQPAIQDNKVASTLREAVMAVRAADINMPLNWAQFVHYGA
ncbi:CHAT domain-containing protein [Fusarium acuminatum]|jgi:CHAT domain-containing protein/tetratricopeptide (TPR) repeat protein|uniref:CHAT domain-containing protein n=1 Tax=Fusarium acuminatum TaxID=5515 RepID=A0ABZ2X2U9_9HYPO